MLAYILNKPLDGSKLLKDIQNLINKNIGEDKVLTIQIQNIKHNSTSHIIKLEHKKL